MTCLGGAVSLAQGVPCTGGSQPGATLLVPYFEVDVEAADGRTTLVAVANRDSEGVFARVTLWTDWGLPTTAFDLEMAAGQVVTLNLRDVFAGSLPSQALGPPCSQDRLDPAELRARHTGRPSPTDGRCHGQPRGEPELAAGFLTVDATNGCPASRLVPGDEGYFVAGGEGVASNRNVLWGDFFLIDPAQDLAQGFRALSLRANAEAFAGDGLDRSFYSSSILDLDDQRLPLGLGHRLRYLDGGPFDGGTEVLFWNGWSFAEARPVPCGEVATDNWALFHRISVLDEDGALLREDLETFVPRAGRRRVGEAPYTSTAGFGVMEITHLAVTTGIIDPPIEDPVQTWAAPVMSARGRFSVGLRASVTAGYCRE